MSIDFFHIYVNVIIIVISFVIFKKYKKENE